MPSPIGHFLAGASVALVANRGGRLSARWPRVVAWAAVAAAAPDLDLVTPWHRMGSHSLFAAAVVFVGVLAATRASRRTDARLAAVLALAYATHLVTDLLGVDTGPPAGLQLWWPWSHDYLAPGWSVFLGTERRDLLSLETFQFNAAALVREVLVLGPICWISWRLGMGKKVGQRS